MKKYFIGFCQLFLSVLILNAQNECLTPSSQPPAWIFSKSPSSTQALITSNSKLNIFVHIVRSSSGTGLSSNIIQPILSSLNSYYQGVIQFNLLGSDFINNDTYYIDLTIAEANALFNIGNHCNAIDIYVLGVSTTFGGAGMAQDIPSKAYIVHGSYYNTSTLPHEMGHCLGLYHTHHGTVNEGGGDLSQCAELVNGSNSSTCGDYISDTPADPNVWSVSSCTYTGTGVDANGQTYHPSTSNLMSYAYKPCRTNFTASQIQRIHDFINNTQIIQNTLFATISGPTLLCTSGAYVVNDIPNNWTVSWNKSSNITLPTDITSNPITASANANGIGWMEATINSTFCAATTLPRYTVSVGTPVVTVTGPSEGYPNVQYTFQAHTADPANTDPFSYEWTMAPYDGYISTSQGGNYAAYAYITFYHPYSAAGYYVKSRAHNLCGTGNYGQLNIWIHEEWLISPNPASENVTLIKKESDTFTDNSFEINNEDINEVYDIKIIDFYGSVRYSTTRSGHSFSIPVSGLNDGNYIIQITSGKKTSNLQLIIKH